jgi:hypothetical protein
MTVKSIHTRLHTIGRRVTLRAVYKSVTKLLNAKVLIKVGKYLLVDQEWAGRVRTELGSVAPPDLAVGEKASYTFVSIANLDAFWKTMVLPLEEATRTREIFFYNPHNFWAYLPERKNSEDAYYGHFAPSGRHGFFTVGGETVADLEFKRQYQSEYLQIDLRTLDTIRRSDHITIIGSYIVSVRIGKRLAERIDQLYATRKGTEEILPDLVSLCARPGKHRFVLEHNPEKADKLKRKLALNFYFRRTE